MIGTGNSGVVYLNRRIRNRTYGGVGGRRGRLLLLPDSKLEHFPFFWDTTFISAIRYCVLFSGNWVFGNCIFAMRNPHFGQIVYSGYKSNLLKKFTLRSLILNFSYTLNDSIQARNINKTNR